MFQDKTALILDMNSTFMFGEDRFGDDEDFSIRYAELGGTLGRFEVQQIVRAAYRYLDERYPDPTYREDFPTVREALSATLPDPLPAAELDRIVATFAFHELGNIPPAYARALRTLRSRYTLGAVVDIWAPKDLWLEAFEGAGIADVFSTCQFSSDHRIVKPSPLLFQRALREMGVQAFETSMIGDSPRRDLGGARAAGIDCVLVGGATHPDAVASFDTLLDIADEVLQRGLPWACSFIEAQEDGPSADQEALSAASQDTEVSGRAEVVQSDRTRKRRLSILEGPNR